MEVPSLAQLAVHATLPDDKLIMLDAILEDIDDSELHRRGLYKKETVIAANIISEKSQENFIGKCKGKCDRFVVGHYAFHVSQSPIVDETIANEIPENSQVTTGRLLYCGCDDDEERDGWCEEIYYGDSHYALCDDCYRELCEVIGEEFTEYAKSNIYCFRSTYREFVGAD